MKMKHCRFILLNCCIIILLFSTGFASANAPKNIIKKVWYSNDTVTVTIDLPPQGQKPRFRCSTLPGNWFYIDIENSTIINSLDIPINLDDVAQIRRGQFNQTTARIVIRFNKSGITPHVKYVGGGVPKLIVSWEGSASKAQQKKFTILIDPGHGGKDDGAIGPVKGLKEKYVTIDIALKLEKELTAKRKDINVVLTRRSDIFIDPQTRRRISEQIKPDIFISIHVNSSSANDKLNQTEIYYYDPKSKPLANVVRDELINQLNRQVGKIRRTPYVVVYKNPAAYGSVLVESCYISSTRGEEKLSQDSYRKEIAKGLFKSIESFLNTIGLDN
jgi:N-acetylmuramoyl-L-alanine amidase